MVGAAVVATLIALFFAEENWRGKRAWELCKNGHAAKGEVLDWAKYIPDPIPDDENIIKAPKMAEWFIKPKAEATYSNELSAKLSLNTLAAFAQCRHSNAVAEVTVVPSNAAGDLSAADLVLRLQGRVLSLAPTNLADQLATEAAAIPPLIVFDDIPLTKAIAVLARQEELKVEWDSELLAKWHRDRGSSREPRISVRWENVSARKALFQLLVDCGLRGLQDPDTGVIRIAVLSPSDTDVIVTESARRRAQALFRRSLTAGADDTSMPSLDAPQGFTLVADTPGSIVPLCVELVTEDPLPRDFFRVVFGRQMGELADYGGNGWHAEQSNSNRFRIFFGRDRIYAAADYLAWSDRFAPEFDLIREALKRPRIRMDGNYQRPFETPTVNFVNIRIVAQAAASRAQCCLLLGRSEQAFRELSLIFELRRLLTAKPTTLVAAMMDVAISGLYVQTIADGFGLQAWREPELIALQKQLQQINLLLPVAEALHMERVGVCYTLETTSARELARLFSPGRANDSFWNRITDPIYLLLKFGPRGWVYQNLVVLASVREIAIEAYDTERQTIKPGVPDADAREIERMILHRSPYNILALMALPNFVRAMEVAARNQTMNNQALIVWGLERYRLAHGTYPETLDALVPQFVEKLPPDIIGGQSLHYYRTQDGRFVLYSIGWNEKDDGGQIVLDKKGTPDREKGDWVWATASK